MWARCAATILGGPGDESPGPHLNELNPAPCVAAPMTRFCRHNRRTPFTEATVGRMVMQMVGAFAEFERAMIRERPPPSWPRRAPNAASS